MTHKFADRGVASTSHLPIIVKGPWRGVEDLPVQQAVAVNAERPVAARQLHVATPLRRQDKICHGCIQVDPSHSHVRIVLHPVCT